MHDYSYKINDSYYNPVEVAEDVRFGKYSVADAKNAWHFLYATDDSFTELYSMMFGEESLKSKLKECGLSNRRSKNNNLGIFPDEVKGFADEAILRLSIARRLNRGQKLTSKDLYDAGLIEHPHASLNRNKTTYSRTVISFAESQIYRNAIVKFFKEVSRYDEKKCWQFATHNEKLQKQVAALLQEEKCPHFCVKHEDSSKTHESHVHFYFASCSSAKLSRICNNIIELCRKYKVQNVKYALKSISLAGAQQTDSRSAFENIANYIVAPLPKRGGFNSRTYFNSKVKNPKVFDTRLMKEKVYGKSLEKYIERERARYETPEQVFKIVDSLVHIFCAHKISTLTPAALKLANAIINHTRRRRYVAAFEFFQEALSTLLQDDRNLHATALDWAHKYTGLQRRFMNAAQYELANAIKLANVSNYKNLNFFAQVNKYKSGIEQLKQLDSRDLFSLFYTILTEHKWRELDRSAAHWSFVPIDAYEEALNRLKSSISPGASPPLSNRSFSL